MSELLEPNSHLNQTSYGSERYSSNENDTYTSFDVSTNPDTSTGVKPVKTKEVIQNNDKNHHCSYCLKVFSNRNAKKRHEWTHTGERKYKCSYCPNAYLYSHSRTVHERTHTGEKPYSCSYCGKSFTFLNSKIRHERIHTNNFPYKCTICTSSFNTQHLLDIHNATHLKAKMKEDKAKEDKPKPEPQPNQETSKRSAKSISVKLFKCSYCPKLWRNGYERKRHEKIHTRDLPFKCTYCPKAFSQRGAKVNHEKVHLPENVDAPTSNSNQGTTPKLKKKSRRNKLQMRTHKCNYCTKAFFCPSSLMRHERIHTGEKPFSCEYCFRSFAARSNMVKHRSIHLKNKLSADDVHNRILKADTQNQIDLPSSIIASSYDMKFEQRTEDDKDERKSNVSDIQDVKPRKGGPLSKTSKDPKIVPEIKETKRCSLCLRSYQGIVIKNENNYSPSLCPACSSAFFHDAHP